MSHLIKVSLFYFAATLITAGFGLGATFGAGMILPGVVVAGVVSAAAVFCGVYLTMQARASFKLMQTGRFVQYGSFWLTGALALKVASLLLSSVLVVSNVALASFAAMAISMAAATLFGQIPWKGRTWLPRRMPNRK